MAYIPADAKWYVAEIVEEYTIEGEPNNVVHTNLVLIRANSPEEAYDRAMLLGKEGEVIYENPEGKKVTLRFRGLRDLNVVHGELQHGTELIYEERIGMSQPEIDKLISRREDLGVFRPLKRQGID